MDQKQIKELLMRCHLIMSNFLIGEASLNDLRQVRSALGQIHDGVKIDEPAEALENKECPKSKKASAPSS